MSNRTAFLTMIGMAEGTIQVAGSDNGYNVMVGNKLFDSYADHPRIIVSLPKLGIASSAAGRYQILSRFFDVYKRLLNLSDFSPMSQDAIAMQMIRECHAQDDIDLGYISRAIIRCNSRWASLPGNDYEQRHLKIDDLMKFYLAAGGTLSENA